MTLLFFQTIAWQWISLIFVIFVYAFVVYLIIKTLLQNRNPVSTLSWVMVLIMLPFLGIVLYMLFGQKVTRRWIFQKLHYKELQQMNHIVNSQLKDIKSLNNIDDPFLADFRKLISLLLRKNKSFLSSNNNINIFHNGYELYEQIYRDLEAATEFIHLQYYIFEDGVVADKIKEILIKKSNKGLNVIMILDGIGSRKYSEESISELRENGVEVLLFRPVHFPTLTNKINHRNHRKIILIDGKMVYSGGINISDKYLIKSHEEGFWRDTHLKIMGDSIKMFQAIFLVDRYMITKHIFKDIERYFPEINEKEGAYVQIATNSPVSDSANVLNAYFTAITTAKRSVKLVSPYFIPEDTLLMALKNAAQGGIDVEIIIPGISDSIFVQMSARSYVEQLLLDGIKVYFYQTGFIHAKILLVDDIFSMVGTANFDYRSLAYNFEVNTLIYDEKINTSLQEQFEIDKQDSELIILTNWRNRSIKNKLFESVARLIAPLM